MRIDSISLDSIEVELEPRFKLSPRPLNDTFGRTLIPGQISVIHGLERAPMTAIAHQVMTCVARQGKHAIYIDSGGTNYSATLTRTFLSGDKDSDKILSRISVAPVLGLEDLEFLYRSIQQLDQVGIIIIDSLTGILNLSSPPASKGRQRKLFKALESLRELVNATQAHLLLTDHSSIDWRKGVARPMGGNVIAHGVDSVTKVTSLQKDSVRVQVERSPVTPSPGGVVIKVSHRGLRSLKSS